MTRPISPIIHKLVRLSGTPTNGLTLGIDIGIASMGWALLEENGELSSFKAVGVRTWDVPEDRRKKPKNAERRESRLMRRTIRHKKARLRETRALFVEMGLVPDAGKDFIPQLIKEGVVRGDVTPWQMRSDGLNRRLDGPEMAVALYHISSHRGYFDSSKKKTNKDPEGKALLSALAHMEGSFVRSGYRTVGEWFASDPDFGLKKRNSEGKYLLSVTREMLRDEVRALFRSQRKYGSAHSSVDFEQRFERLFYEQKPVASQISNIGFCGFIPDRRRTTSFAPSFERKRFLEKLHNLRWSPPGSKDERRLSQDEISKLMLLGSRKLKTTYKDCRKALQIDSSMRFKGIPLEDETKHDICKRSGNSFEGTCRLRQAIGDEDFKRLTADSLETADAIAETIAFNNDLNEIQSILVGAISEEMTNRILAGFEKGLFDAFKGTASLSSEACRVLIPHLESGLPPHEAEKKAGFDKQKLEVPDLEEIGNPVVRKALGETLKTVLEIVRTYGRPARINVELARDIGKSPEERGLIESGMKRQADRKETLRKEFESLAGHAPSGAEFLRFSLWKEQDNRCIYSGTGIPLGALVDGNNSVQVDHALPLSRFHDDSYHNKVLCLTAENAEKAGRSAYEFISADHGEGAWTEFAMRVEGMRGLKGMKKRNLLLLDAAEREESFRSRNLNDTRYIAKVALALLGTLYGNDGKKHVFARQGQMTGLMRRLWGLNDLKFADGKRIPDGSHHAVDAMVVAAINESMMQRISASVRAAEVMGRQAVLKNAAQPWDGFRYDVLEQISNSKNGDGHSRILVSRETRANASGPAHKETVYRLRESENGDRQTYERKSVVGMELADLARIPDQDRNASLIGQLREWLSVHPSPKDRIRSGQAPLVGPTGAIVSKVRLVRSRNDGVDVRKGMAERVTTVRLDVFSFEGKFYAEPIYLHQVANKIEWPRAPAISLKDGRVIGNSHFACSLYKRSLVEISDKEGAVQLGHYVGFDIDSGRVTVELVGTSEKSRVSIRSMMAIQKIDVDRLGKCRPVKREKRIWRGAVCT